jgi:hypothetical protein
MLGRVVEEVLGDLLTAFPSLGEVPREFPPFKLPCSVTRVGSGSKAILQTTPPGGLKL